MTHLFIREGFENTQREGRCNIAWPLDPWPWRGDPPNEVNPILNDEDAEMEVDLEYEEYEDTEYLSEIELS